MPDKRLSNLASFARKLVAHFRVPLYRNAYAWMVSTGVTSGLGILYWIVAGKFYTPETVGTGSALISTVLLLSGVSQLNLMHVLIRYVPQAGRATRKLIGYSYAIALLGAGIISYLALAVFRIWDNQAVTWIIVSVILWSIFNLQDSVLTGLGDAIWVPVENISFAIAKIVLLVLLAKSLPEQGIFTSWMVPVALVIIPINVLIFRRLIPGHEQPAHETYPSLHRSEIIQYAAGNYLGSIFILASTRLLPVIVTQQAGARAGAFFFLAWTIANSLKLVAMNMAMSLTVEGAKNQNEIESKIYRFLAILGAILLPAIAILFITAPYILRLSGNSYSEAGTTLLRLLAISVIPAILTSVFISIARVKNKVALIAVSQGLFCGLVLSLSLVLLKPYGITGVGYAFLLSETIVAIGLLIYHIILRNRSRKGTTNEGVRNMFNHEFVAVKSAIQKTTPPTIRRGLLTLRDRGLNTIIRYRLRNKWEGSWPDFIIVGTQKGGTTYIYDELCRHPAILPAISKEIHYFDHNFYRGTDWYQAFFERSQHIGNGYNKKFITGEASPSYIFHPHAARRIQELKPDTRLIVMLRNPVNRAYSHYQHEVRLGYETLSFEEAIEREQERLSGERERMLADEDYESVNYMHYSYLARGVYINQLQTLRNYFPEEQILIIKSEEFFKDTQAVMRQVFAFLGLPDWKSDDQKKPKHFPYSPMNPKTRWYLIDFFKPYNEELFKYSGVNYGWNQ